MELQLTNGVTLIDRGDYKKLSRYSWYCSAGGYAVRTDACRKTVYLHKEVMKPPPGMEVDHLNHKKLDNRKINLKTVTHQENMINYPKPRSNTSGYKNVNWHKQMNKWQVAARRNNIRKSYGLYDSLEEAARVAASI